MGSYLSKSITPDEVAPSTPMASSSTKSITAKDVLQFYKHRLHCMGELGFETRFPEPDKLFNSISDNLELPAESEQAVISAMQSTHDDLRQLQRQAKLLNLNPSAVAEAEAMMDDKLRHLGRSARYIGAQSLSKKVKEVTESENPKLKPNYISVSVVRPSPASLIASPAEWIGVNLPIEGNIQEIHRVLRDVLKGDCIERSLQSGQDRTASDITNLKWKYQLLPASRSQLLDKPSSKLETEQDWKALRSALRDDKKVSGPILILIWAFPKLQSIFEYLKRIHPDHLGYSD